MIEKLIKKKENFIPLLEFIIAIFSISSYSLWTDEGIRLHAIVFGNLKEVVHYGLADKQLFFVLKQYIWTTIFGTSEIATRSLNLVFVLLIITYLNRILRARNINVCYGLILFISPMFIYYMNDAGPYIMMLSYSFAFIYYIFFSREFNSKKNIFMINVVFLLGVGTHFIFGFVYLIYLVKILESIYRKKIHIKTHFFIGLLFSPIYLTLLVIYLQAIESGASRGWDPPTILNVFFVLYSFIGSGGLSLSRNEIRAGNFETIQWHQLVAPSLLVIVMGLLLWISLKYRRVIIKPYSVLLAGTAVYGIVFFVFSYKWHFHFWERHFITAYAVFILLLIEVASRLSVKKMTAMCLSLLVALFLLSSFQLRFNPYYGKDNYKDTLFTVLHSKKAVILYQGDWKVSNYYGVDALDFNEYEKKTSKKDARGLTYVIDIRNKSKKEIEEISAHYPQEDVLIVLNEKYDSFNTLPEYKKNSNYTEKKYNTFSIFQK
ncbi:hypothetical protein RAK27_11315 [Carnobacterium maltaromaticum]|uniref:Glycosyltransferase RgtA/B/C/D-like domain-containing protein n=1 Tax=Carnobacterium maltaromaticum TaxID=2751 RepID=A0AAW9K3X2_CARML|nr:hypothetical protein [Carnobacterium maltaromaticum]MDZ5759250.1 hypothetical protein [Carnobacterium maltaromaticum]